MSEEQTSFKVTDRRLFNADGSPRELSPDEKTESQSPSVAATPATAIDSRASASSSEPVAAPAAAPAVGPAAGEFVSTPQGKIDQASATDEEDFAEADIPDADDPAGFVNFAMSIASNAAAALGMMEHPVTRKREVDLELGKHWIDVLGMLEKKTRGNLTAPEAQILEGWLADLRMQYVSLTGSTAPKTASAFTGHDITGGKP